MIPKNIVGKKLITFLGQRLCPADEDHTAGCGTYERQGYIYSTLAGIVKIIKQEKVSIVLLCNNYYYYV